MIAAAGVAAAAFAPSLAEARPYCWGHHCGWHRGYYAPRPVYVAPRPYYVAPPRVYYAPPPVYYRPPAYYAPAPVVVPSFSLGINIPLR
jgi:hypothetical protein